MPAPVDPNEFLARSGKGPKPRPFEQHEGSATRKGKTSRSALTCCSGTIKAQCVVNKDHLGMSAPPAEAEGCEGCGEMSTWLLAFAGA